MKLTIYIPESMAADLRVLPPRSISRICQEALRIEVAKIRNRANAMLLDAFEED